MREKSDEREREREGERRGASPGVERRMEEWKREVTRELSSLRGHVNRTSSLGNLEERCGPEVESHSFFHFSLQLIAEHLPGVVRYVSPTHRHCSLGKTSIAYE